MKSAARTEIASKLMKDGKFKALKCNSERIHYVLDNVLDFESLLTTIKTRAKSTRERTNKSDDIAQNFKLESELFLRDDNQASALTAVHKALRYVPYSNVSLRTKLYSLKARIHYEQEDFTGALYSLELTTSDGSLPDLEHYLLKLQCLVKLCQYRSTVQLIDEIVQQPELLQQRSDLTASNLLKLKEYFRSEGEGQNKAQSRRNEKFYSYRLDPRCTIVQSAQVGRHFVAVDDIPSGHVLLEERPYSVIMEPEYWYKKCSSCLLDLKHKFFPCAFCNELVFCDENCFKEAWQTFHQFECGLAFLLRSITSPSFHVFRIISRVGLHEALHVQKLKATYSIEQYLRNTRPPKNLPDSQKSAEQRHHDFLMASILCDHEEMNDPASTVYHTIVALELAALLQLGHNFRAHYPNREFLVDLVSLIVVEVRRIIYNVFGWHEYNEDSSHRGYVANCQGLVSALFNHSCMPNTNWAFNDGVISFTTVRPILKGTEITITYGPCKEMTYYKRQERLNHYLFACKCAACFSDALKGDNLRCLTCNGPVVFGSALNKVKQLDGKCLVCATLRPHFDQSIKELAQVKETVRDLANLLLLMPNEAVLLKQAIELTEKMTALSLCESKSVCSATLACSWIIEQFDLHGTHSMEQRIELALLFDRALPPRFESHQIDGKSIATCAFWLKLLAEFWLEEEAGCSLNLLTIMGEQNHITEPRQVWNSLLHFHERLNAALRDLVSNVSSKFVLKLTGSLECNYDKIFDQCQKAYSEQACFVTPQV